MRWIRGACTTPTCSPAPAASARRRSRASSPSRSTARPGVSSRPCGKCRACTEIDSGRFVDMLEVDAATNTKVDEMRELLDTAQYMPVSGRYKVYIIDEVHMLSRHAFNSMLKTLEEPPEHVKFILATTDPQRLPVTVLSRCLQFNLKSLAPQALAGHLKHVLEAEGIPFEEPALLMLAAGRGGQRARQPEPHGPGHRVRFRHGHGDAGRRHAGRRRRRPRLAAAREDRRRRRPRCARGSRAHLPSAAFPATRRCRTSPRSCIASRSRSMAREADGGRSGRRADRLARRAASMPAACRSCTRLRCSAGATCRSRPTRLPDSAWP